MTQICVFELEENKNPSITLGDDKSYNNNNHIDCLIGLRLQDRCVD